MESTPIDRELDGHVRTGEPGAALSPVRHRVANDHRDVACQLLIFFYRSGEPGHGRFSMSDSANLRTIVTTLVANQGISLFGRYVTP